MQAVRCGHCSHFVAVRWEVPNRVTGDDRLTDSTWEPSVLGGTKSGPAEFTPLTYLRGAAAPCHTHTRHATAWKLPRACDTELSCGA
jgi:hypothetical protein